MKILSRKAGMPMFLLLAVLAVVPAGCAIPTVSQSQSPAARRAHDPDPAAKAMSAAHRPSGVEDGSLWVDGGSLSEMFINDKARRVGDIVTIKIVESSKATNKATTATDRTSTLDVGLGSLFNLENNWPNSSAVFNPFSTAQGSYNSKFDGGGTTARSGDLNAFITARIVDVLPNGNLIIEGNREVRVNHENQIITITGMVRPRDVSAENVILSTYVADARISYSGSGIVNDKQRPGWLVRLLDNIWPF